MQPLVFGLPSKGRLKLLLDSYFSKFGLYQIYADRRYRKVLNDFPAIEFRFMPTLDLAEALVSGDVDLCITGYDLMCECCIKRRVSNVHLYCKFNFGAARLCVLVPDQWFYVNTIDDLSILSFNCELVVSSKYPHIANLFLQRYLYNYRVSHSFGVIELEPFVGYADFVIDLVTTGSTLEQNNLKLIERGTILESCACLFYKNRAFNASFYSFTEFVGLDR